MLFCCLISYGSGGFKEQKHTLKEKLFKLLRKTYFEHILCIIVWLCCFVLMKSRISQHKYLQLIFIICRIAA